jgi:small subunit ribosomal protein S10e
MLIPKANRKAIYQELFKGTLHPSLSWHTNIVEGILVAKKDFNAPSHVDLHKIPNLQVIKACQSLTSRGYVKTQFSWQYYYYILTNEGIGMAQDM